MSELDVVTIHTDGACIPNPGPGGWGALLRQGSHELELCGGEAGATTNNRMELMAPIQALTVLKRRVRVELYTDSTYVRSGITQWVVGWERNGWQTKAKQPVKNVDLWKQLKAAVEHHDVHWHWVKGHADDGGIDLGTVGEGHAGDAGNERADRLAARGLEEAVAAARVSG